MLCAPLNATAPLRVLPLVFSPAVSVTLPLPLPLRVLAVSHAGTVSVHATLLVTVTTTACPAGSNGMLSGETLR